MRKNYLRCEEIGSNSEGRLDRMADMDEDSQCGK